MEFTAPDTPKTINVRVTVSDGTFEITRWLSVTPANHSPEILSLLAEIGSLQTDTPQLYAGRELDFIATARDADWDPLTYRWSLVGTTSEGNATWKAYWNSDDHIYTMRLRVSDGALYDEANLQVTVLGRPDPTVVLSVAPNPVPMPMAVTLTATATDTVGQIERYDWSIQKQSANSSYFYWWRTESTTQRTLTQTFTDHGLYRARARAVNEIGRSGASPWVVSLSADSTDGLVPLKVTFTASDADGQVVEYRWDFNSDGVVAMTSTDITVMHTYAATGTYPARVIVVDNDGLTDTDIAIVTVRPPIPPTVSLSANPNDGIAPLEVVFTATATDTDGQVVEYRWDFENDGVVDQATTAITATHTYAATDTYVAQVVAVDNDGLTDTDIAIVTVRIPIPPTVALSVEPTEGALPLDVTFTAAATDTDGQIAQYRWDFDGNSVVDQTTVDNTTTHTYNTQGTFQPLVTAVDNDGLTATDTATVIVQPPATGVTLSATPSSGAADLEVQFTAAAVNSGNVVEYRWDFDGDGIRDLTTTTGLATHTYTALGTFQAKVEAEYQDETVVSKTVTIRVFAAGATRHPVFDAPMGFLAGVNPIYTAAGDFNGDGTLDMAVVE